MNQYKKAGCYLWQSLQNDHNDKTSSSWTILC